MEGRGFGTTFQRRLTKSTPFAVSIWMPWSSSSASSLIFTPTLYPSRRASSSSRSWSFLASSWGAYGFQAGRLSVVRGTPSQGFLSVFKGFWSIVREREETHTFPVP